VIPACGTVTDRHFYPVEPRTLRVTLETRW